MWMLGLLLSGCHAMDLPRHEYYCPPETSYNAAGQLDVDGYRVDRQCYKYMTLKQRACYKKVRE